MRFVRIVVLASIASTLVASAALAFSIVTEPLPVGVVGQPYSYQVKVTGDFTPPMLFKVDSGGLPPGLTLSDEGLISGIPTQPGSFRFYIDASYVFGSNPRVHKQRQFTLNVIIGLAISNASLGQGTVGAPYSARLTATGGGTQTWTLDGGALPAGLALSSAGVISGTPTTVGSSTFTVKVSDTTGRSARRQYTVQVLEPLLVARPALIPSSTLGAPPEPRKLPPSEILFDFNYVLVATGGLAPYVWSLGTVALPPGLALDPATGVISGAPRLAGTFPLQATVKDANGTTTTVDVTLQVARKLKVVTRRLPFVVRGDSYRAQILTRGGVERFTFKVTDARLPRGIRMNRRNGLLIGKARTAPGVYRFAVTVTDRLGASFERRLAIVVKPPKK